MQTLIIDNLIADKRAAVHWDPAGAVPMIWRFLSSAWLRHQERQIASAVRRLDHNELLDEYRRASGG